MKIAIQAPRASYYCGGAERYILNLALELQKLENKVFLITYNSPKKTKWFSTFKKMFKGKIILLESNELNKNFHKFKEATKPNLWDLESKLFSKITAPYYQKKRFDIISLHYTFDCFGIPKKQNICLHLHGTPRKIRNIDKSAIKIPSKIIAVSDYVFNGWKKAISLHKKIFIIPNGITNLKFKEIEKSNDVLFFGRLIKTKGVNLLIKSIARVNKTFNEISVKIIGEGPEKEKLKNLAERLNLSKNIDFLGYVSDQKLYKLIEASRISVFPSYAKEGIMTTLLESAKLKSVILASDSCSNKEFISDNKNGLLFKPKNIKDLSEKIKILLLNKHLQERLIKNAYKKVDRFSWEKQTKKILKVYKH